MYNSEIIYNAQAMYKMPVSSIKYSAAAASKLPEIEKTDSKRLKKMLY